MNRPNPPAQPSLVTTAYLDERFSEFEKNLLAALAHELDVRFERLSQEIDARFTERDVRFERLNREIDTRFTERDARTDGLDNRFDGLDNRFDGLESRFHGLENRFDRLEGRFDRFARDLELRLARFENQLAWKIIGAIVAVTAIFSAVVVIAGVD